MRDLNRRIADLERPLAGACLACEIGQLNRKRIGADGPTLPCTHTQRSTLAQVLRKLTAMQAHS